MNDSSIKSGTLLGTIFTLLGIVNWSEMGKTIVLGGIGAVVSFFVSWTLNKVLNSRKNNHTGAMKYARKRTVKTNPFRTRDSVASGLPLPTWTIGKPKKRPKE